MGRRETVAEGRSEPVRETETLLLRESVELRVRERVLVGRTVPLLEVLLGAPVLLDLEMVDEVVVPAGG